MSLNRPVSPPCSVNLVAGVGVRATPARSIGALVPQCSENAWERAHPMKPGTVRAICWSLSGATLMLFILYVAGWLPIKKQHGLPALALAAVLLLGLAGYVVVFWANLKAHIDDAIDVAVKDGLKNGYSKGYVEGLHAMKDHAPQGLRSVPNQN